MIRNFFRALILALLFLVSAEAQAERVRHVVDGDTLVLEDNQRLRLIGVDTPEVDHPRYNRVGEPFGEEAKQFLKSKIEGKEVRLEAGAEAYDKYGRRLAFVYLDGECLNETLLREGYAEAIRYLRYEQKEQYLALEDEAKRAGKGMWAKTSSSPGESTALAGQRGWGEPLVIAVSGAMILAVFVFLQRKR